MGNKRMSQNSIQLVYVYIDSCLTPRLMSQFWTISMVDPIWLMPIGEVVATLTQTYTAKHAPLNSHSLTPQQVCNWWKRAENLQTNCRNRRWSKLNTFLSFYSHPLTVHYLALSLGICHTDVKQHCDMFRRQYKYLISPNGNHHSVLIAPQIIWGWGESVAHICYSIFPSPLPSAHL